MIIKDGKIKNISDLKLYKYGNYEIYYNGFVYLHGQIGVENILNKFCDRMKTGDFQFVNELLGIYFICINDLKKSEKFIFIDNSGLYKAYMYQNVISTSFIELIENIDTLVTPDYDAIVEFLHFGFVYFDKTIIEEINKLKPEFIYIINKNNKLEIIDKNIPRIFDTPAISPEEFFRNLHRSIQRENISIDITGGSDSRLIVSAFQKSKADFELAISGMPENSDIKIAKVISKKLNKNFYPTYHTTEDISTKKIIELFRFTDAQIDLVVYHRIYNYLKDKKNRNVSFQISGLGGELYKDFWWLQDFPLYSKKNANIRKLYKYRIESIEFNHELLHNSLQTKSKKLAKNIISKLSQYKLSSNTRTYDNIYYYFKMQTTAGTFLTLSNKFFKTYAPLLELDLVRYGFNLPREKRFYNNFHRDFITRNCKDISTLKTNAGITCSANVFYKTWDLLNYCLNLGSRMLKQILRKIFKKTYMQENPTNSRIYNVVRQLDIMNNSIEILKKEKILKKDIIIEKISNDLLGKILTLGIFFSKYEKKFNRNRKE